VWLQFLPPNWKRTPHQAAKKTRDDLNLQIGEAKVVGLTGFMETPIKIQGAKIEPKDLEYRFYENTVR